MALIELEIRTRITMESGDSDLDDDLDKAIHNGFKSLMSSDTMKAMIESWDCEPLECIVDQKARVISKEEQEFHESMQRILENIDKSGIGEMIQQMIQKRGAQERIAEQKEKSPNLLDDADTTNIIKFPTH